MKQWNTKHKKQAPNNSKERKERKEVGKEGGKKRQNKKEGEKEKEKQKKKGDRKQNKNEQWTQEDWKLATEWRNQHKRKRKWLKPPFIQAFRI